MPLSKLIELGERLKELESEDQKVIDWRKNCRHTLLALFEQDKRHCAEAHAFYEADFPHGKISVLEAAQYKIKKMADKTTGITVNQSVNQTQNVHNDISMSVRLSIEYSDLDDSVKEEAKELVREISEEVQKPTTNWERVTNLLRRSFDYGLKIAPDIVKLADTYYKAKGGK